MRPALMLVAAFLVGLFAVFGSCTSSYDCCGACAESEFAAFELTCDTTDLVSVTATGPCAMSDESLSSHVGKGEVFVESAGPGVCHVTLTFATGFTFSTDVTFATRPGGVCGGPQCHCPDYVGPTAGPFVVKNPSATCVDAAAGAAGEAGPNVCPADASQNVPCDVAPGETCQGCRDLASFACTCGTGDAGARDAGVFDADAPDADVGNTWQCVDTDSECGR
jgi:hypothetical protein